MIMTLFHPFPLYGICYVIASIRSYVLLYDGSHNEISISYLTHCLVDTEELDFQIWLQEKKSLNLHIETICKKYSKDVKMDLPRQSFMFDSKHNLLFCRNAKVLNYSYMYIAVIFQLMIFLKTYWTLIGWDNKLAEEFLDDIRSKSKAVIRKNQWRKSAFYRT